MSYDPCVFCGSHDLAFDCAISLLGKLDANVTRCRACGLLFVNPVLSPADLRALYGAEYWDPPGMGLSEARRRYHREYRFGAAYGLRLSRLSPSGRMLEIGCGLPFFLRGVADHCAWHVEGIDLARGLARFARDKLDITVTEAAFDAAAFPDAAFDLVRAKDVLEHVPRPVPFLQAVHRLLRGGGRADIWVPNGPLDLAPARRASRRGHRARMDAGHILFIPPRVLRAMLQANGFHIERAQVFSFRYALKALGILPTRPSRPPSHPATHPTPTSSLDAWQQPPPQPGLKGTMLYARLREWRSHHPALPAWLPIGFRLRILARKA